MPCTDCSGPSLLLLLTLKPTWQLTRHHHGPAHGGFPVHGAPVQPGGDGDGHLPGTGHKRRFAAERCKDQHCHLVGSRDKRIPGRRHLVGQGGRSGSGPSTQGWTEARMVRGSQPPGLALVSNTHSPLLVFHQRLWGPSGERTNRDVPYGHRESAATLINCLCGASWFNVRPVCPAALTGGTKGSGTE